MANALDALRILAGGQRYAPRQVVPQEDFQFSGAVPTQGELSSPYEQEQAARAARADEADRARIGSIEALNSEMNQYARPDVTARRDEEFNRALRLKGEGARVTGEANLAATKAAGDLRGLREAFGLERKAQSAQELQAQKDAAMGARQSQTGQNQNTLARVKDLLKQRKTSTFMGMGGGNAADIDAQILALQGGGTVGGEAPGIATAGGPQAGDVKTFPNGTKAVFDGQGWVRQ